MFFANAFARRARHCLYIRNFNTLSSLPINPNRWIYISRSTNPLFNLVLEDWLFKYAPVGAPLLLIYRNRPCVVIGRNQNPWKETNLELMKQLDIPWLRRRSGGGTVYHDLGNTNFSIHMSRETFDRNLVTALVCRAVRSFGVDARVNERNDILVGLHKMSSAYKVVKDRSYQHGTMLISSQLDDLRGLLRNDKTTMKAKGVASVPSPVDNLQKFTPAITHETFTDAVVNEFKKILGYDVLEPCFVDEDEAIRKDFFFLEEEISLSSWDWRFGQTPEFTYMVKNSFDWGDVEITIHSKNGIILSIWVDLDGVYEERSLLERDLGRLARKLRDRNYGPFVDDMDIFTEDERSKEVARWLSSCMDR